MIEAVVPAFVCLCLNFPGQMKHLPFSLRVNGQRCQPFQPCHCVVMAGAGVSVKNFLFLHIQFHNDLPPFICCGAVCPAWFTFLSAGLSASRSCPDFLPAYCPLWCAPVVTKSMILREPFYRVTSPEVIPLAAGHSIFKVLCLLTRTSLPKKGGCSRMSKTLE